MLALPELCNWEMGEGERVSPPPKKIEIEMKKTPKNGRFLLEAAIVEYLRPWEIISNYESNKSRVIKNQAI